MTHIHADGEEKESITAETIFIQPFGWVKKLINFNMSKMIDIGAPRRLRVMLFDPLAADRLRAKEKPNTFVETEVLYNQLFASAKYMVTYALYDNRIYDGEEKIVCLFSSVIYIKSI